MGTDTMAVVDNELAAFKKLLSWEQFQLLERAALPIGHSQGAEAKQRLEMLLSMLEQLTLKKENAKVVRQLFCNSIRYLMQDDIGEWRDFPFMASIEIIDRFERN